MSNQMLMQMHPLWIHLHRSELSKNMHQKYTFRGDFDDIKSNVVVIFDDNKSIQSTPSSFLMLCNAGGGVVGKGGGI